MSDPTEPTHAAPLVASDSQGAVPARLGRFIVRDRVGEGGMGVVYRARDPALDRDVAIKIVAPAHGDGESRERLHREAQALGRVAHPNVVAVYDVGIHDGMVFIAMELVPGETLARWLAREPRSYVAVLEKFIQAGRGLAAAHKAGILHRDFKPANVVVANDGRARVIDFGVARAIDEGGAPASEPITPESPLASPLTNHGDLVGTPPFMSPEHFSGKVSAASDQWSLCVAMYRALFHQPPFEAENIAILRVVIENDEPRSPDLGDVPVAIADAIMRGLRRDPDARWPSVEALVDALELELRTVSSPDSKRTRRYRRIAAVALASLALTIEVFRDHRNDASMSIREHLLYSFVGVAVAAGFAFVWRRELSASAYNRKVALVFFLALGGPCVHRVLALSSQPEAAFVLRTDAVIAAAIYVLGSVTVERWLALAAGVMALYVPLTFVSPVVVGPAYGCALFVVGVLAVWFWRDASRGR